MKISKLTGIAQAISLVSLIGFFGGTSASANPSLERTSRLERSRLTNSEIGLSENHQASQLLPLANAAFNEAPIEHPANTNFLVRPPRPPARSPQHSPPRTPPSKRPAENLPPNPSHTPSLLSEKVTRINARVPMEALDSTLEIRGRSESPQVPSIFIVEDRKESFELSMRHVVSRSPQSEFSLSFGFVHRDESLPNRPPGPPPAGSNGEIPPPLSNREQPSPSPLSPSADSAPPRRPPNGRPLPPPPSPSANPAATPTEVAAISPSSNRPPARPAVPASNYGIRTGTLLFSQNYRQGDSSGRWLMRSQFNLGTELASAPPQQNSSSQFMSWTGFLERTQVLNDSNNLMLRLETQLSPSNLLGPHQFKMKTRGFEQFERESRPSEISGNNGIRLRFEDRMILTHHSRTQAPLLTLIPFVDLGYAWGQGDPNRSAQQFLGRTGLGLSVQPLTGLDIGLDYFFNWGDLRADADTQSVYAVVGYETQW